LGIVNEVVLDDSLSFGRTGFQPVFLYLSTLEETGWKPVLPGIEESFGTALIFGVDWGGACAAGAGVVVLVVLFGFVELGV